jgi:nitrous oxidase accessory protein
LITLASLCATLTTTQWYAPVGPGRSGRAASFALLFLILWLPSPLLAADLEVPSSEFPTVGEAIAAAASGDVIRLAPGVYSEQLVIDKPLSMIGSPEGEAVIQGSAKGRVIEVTSSDVEISGLVVRGSGDVIEDSDACIYIREEAASVRVSGNRLSECAFGIWVNGSKKPVITDNVVTGYQKKIFSDRGNGIHIWRIEDGLIKGNRVHDVRDGIYLSNTEGSLIEGNRMDSVRFGIHFMYNHNNSVIGNTTCNSMVGQAMMFSKRLVIHDNTMINNDDHGLFLRSIYDSKVRGNVSYGNNRGIFLVDSSFNELTGNWAQENAIGVNVTSGSVDNVVLGNSFISNPVQVLYSWRTSQYWDSKEGGNYWSDYLGWDYDSDGIGDKIYYASNRMDHLMHRHPKMRLLALSPVIQLLQALETRFPVLRPASVIDRKPTMRPPRSVPTQLASLEETCQ